ncbi:hypothetical protein [Sporosarcina sp. P3]|uniref:hypothetical protein n=1 Tax=Sporosarcina sp. P3 TaxID=2048245 RepID=UPI0013043E75|nr:hypothetical protein [Sporosarcina sp. P3]
MAERIKASLFVSGLLLICIALFVYSLPLGLLGTGACAIVVSLILDYELQV